MNTVKKVITYLLTTILRPITDAVVIRAIEKGEISEREIVEKAKRKLIRSLDEELPKCVDYDEEAAKGAAILKKRAMAAKTIDDMLKIQNESKELKYFNRVFKKATKQHDCVYTLKHYIDSHVQKKVNQALKCYLDEKSKDTQNPPKSQKIKKALLYGGIGLAALGGAAYGVHKLNKDLYKSKMENLRRQEKLRRIISQIEQQTARDNLRLKQANARLEEKRKEFKAIMNSLK